MLSFNYIYVLSSAVLRRGSAANNKCEGDNIAITDNGNYIVDLYFTEEILNVEQAAYELKNTVGVVEHGIFSGMAATVIVAGKDGVRVAGAGGEKPWW